MAPQNQIQSTNHYRRALGYTDNLEEALYPLIYGSSSKIQRNTQAGMGDYELTGLNDKGHMTSNGQTLQVKYLKNYLAQNQELILNTPMFNVLNMSRKKDSIIRLPSDPKKLEAYFKTLPPEVIEGFAQNALKEGERHDASEMAKLISETIFRLAWANEYGPITGGLSDEQINC